MDNLSVIKSLPTSPRSYKAETDCVASINTEQFSFTVSGTGATFTTVPPTALENCFGILKGTLGTTATGRVSIASSNPNIFRFSSGQSIFQSYFRMTALSDTTNTYTIRVGFIDNISGESTDGIFFRYTNGVNSGKWQAVVRINNVETVVDTGILATLNTWIFAGITVSSLGIINWTLNSFRSTTSAILSNIVTGYGIMAMKSLGTANTSPFDCDYIEVTHNFTLDRI